MMVTRHLNAFFRIQRTTNRLSYSILRSGVGLIRAKIPFGFITSFISPFLCLPKQIEISQKLSNLKMIKAHDRLVWIDCEMTGLDLSKEQIIEIACIITDKNLEPVDEGMSYVIGVEKKILDQMGEWCTVQHGKSGLTEECLKSKYSLKQVDQLVRNYIEQHIPNSRGQAIIAGNSVYADKAFLEKDMPITAEYLHYRIVDVSSIKELARRWNHDVFLKSKDTSTPSAHRALDDIRDSIKELQYYKSNFFLHK